MSLESCSLSDNPCVRGLINLYTGKPLPVMVVITMTGVPRASFFSPDAVTPADWFDTLEALTRVIRMRKGVVDAVSAEEALFCPYSGRGLSIQHDEGFGYTTLGGFNPRTPQVSAEMFAYLAFSRNGVPNPAHPKPDLEAHKAVKAVVRAPTLVEIKTAISDETADMASNAVSDLRKAAGVRPVAGATFKAPPKKLTKGKK